MTFTLLGGNSFFMGMHVHVMINLISICLFARYGRAEVMAGFVNGLFLVFVAFFIFSEAVEVSVLFFKQIPQIVLYSVLLPLTRVMIN